MTSWALRHQKRIDAPEAKRDESSARAKTPRDHHKQKLQLQNNHKTYGLLCAALEEDLRTIGEIKATEKRAELKRQLLPKYQNYVDGYVAAIESSPTASHANDVLVQAMIWTFDVGDIPAALDLADVCIRDSQHMPARFARRDIETFAADALFDWAALQVKAGHSPNPYLDRVLAHITSGEWDVVDDIRAKYHKLAGEHAHETGSLQMAEQHLLAAQQYGASVKTRLNKVQAEIAKAKPAE